jgi:3-methyladenine DNA glycosylase/8-oxoguanine DNA glycosylase
MRMQILRLTKRRSLVIEPLAPFHFDGTFHKPSHFPDQLSHWIPGAYWQPMRLGAELFGVRVQDKGTRADPSLTISLYADRPMLDATVNSLKDEIIWRFELRKDLHDFNALARQDKRFYPVFAKWLGMRNASGQNLYELLILAIVLQNARASRTVQMLAALLQRYGTRLRFDNRELFAMWLPATMERVAERDLRDLRIGYRAKFIKRLSADFARGTMNEHALRAMDKDDAQRELLKLHGVGPETARILLFEALHHDDTFGHIAPWQRKIYSRLFYNRPMVSAERIRSDIIRRYGKYAMLAVHYIWEDIFWRRRNQKIAWLEREIRL